MAEVGSARISVDARNRDAIAHTRMMKYVWRSLARMAIVGNRQYAPAHRRLCRNVVAAGAPREGAVDVSGGGGTIAPARRTAH